MVINMKQLKIKGVTHGELDGYIRGRLRSFEAKKRNWNTILFTLPVPELRKMGLVSLSSLLNPSPAKGKVKRKLRTGNPFVQFDEEREVVKTSLLL
jgi:hypothetical protein